MMIDINRPHKPDIVFHVRLEVKYNIPGKITPYQYPPLIAE